ncbi:MAG: hypothetical protein IPN99_00070 [Bacteroidetes bacterium]|nr:hypothetical protein [Bacteroidota bacterium]
MKNTHSLLLLLVFFASMECYAGANEDLFAACKGGDFAKATAAITAGADVNSLDAGNPPIASAFLWPDITKLLLDKGADPNLGEYPALVQAATFYSTEVIKLLLAAGADPNKPGKTNPGATFKSLIEKEKAKGKDGNKDLIKAWETALKAAKPTEIYPLYSVVMNTNCVPCAKLLFEKGAKADLAVYDGNGLMHTFALYAKSISARRQVFAAAKTSMESYGIKMPEWYAEDMPEDRLGTPDEMMALLLSQGLNINEKNKGFAGGKPTTPLTLAIAGGFGSEEIIRLFIKNGADLKETGLTNKVTPFAEETQNADKIKVKYDFPREGRNSNGGGYSANMDLLKSKPKKVALISYYLYDPGKGKVQGGTYTGSVTTSVWRTSDIIGQTQINGFYGESIAALKSSFKDNGVDLLTPDEFLDTPEKSDFYYNFNQESAKKEKTTITKRGAASSNVWDVAVATASTLKISPAGKGYRSFFVCNEAADESTLSNFDQGIFSANRKLTSSLGYDLAKGLDVDAVVVVYICTRKIKSAKDDYGVNAVVMTMMGPNPGKAEDSDKEAKNIGQFYCGTRTYYSSPVIFKEEKGLFGQYEGMANILKAHATKMCKYVNGKEKDE